uniref:Putative ovule protein n=1 Tax=Solanum chacoense TaxID=4108 RepID=A0A0V0GXZ0_SOLCH
MFKSCCFFHHNHLLCLLSSHLILVPVCSLFFLVLTLHQLRVSHLLCLHLSLVFLHSTINPPRCPPDQPLETPNTSTPLLP